MCTLEIIHFCHLSWSNESNLILYWSQNISSIIQIIFFHGYFHKNTKKNLKKKLKILEKPKKLKKNLTKPKKNFFFYIASYISIHFNCLSFHRTGSFLLLFELILFFLPFILIMFTYLSHSSHPPYPFFFLIICIFLLYIET